MTTTETPPALLTVIAPGLGTTVQDTGRPGWQRFGVPVSGALDRIAIAAANVVAGNAPDAAALECLYTGCTLQVGAAAIRCAVAGAGASLNVSIAGTIGVAAHSRAVAALESFTAPPGSRITVRIPGPSISAYLAIAGGIATAPVLGSRSTYVRAGFGGIDGRRLAAGTVIPCCVSPRTETASDRRLLDVDLAPRKLIRVVLGPQDDGFTTAALEALAAAEYTVTPLSDRMGLRLDGPRLEHTSGADILSDGIAPGAIQVPGSGLPIIMLADRQTTGGYTKIATVISADVPVLGRVGPGAQIRFVPVDIETAEAAARALAAEMASWPERLVPVTPYLADIERALLERNLVSGVIDASAPWCCALP